MHARLPELLGRAPSEDLAARFLAKVLYPVVLLGPRQRRAHYERYLAGSGYSFDRLMHEQSREMDDFWRVKGWPPGLARLGWQAQRALVRGQRLLRPPEAA